VQSGNAVDVDVFFRPEYGDDDGQAHGDFRGGHGDDDEDQGLALDLAEVIRQGYKNKLAALNIISMLMNMISGSRRMTTPIAPMAKIGWPGSG